MPLPRRPRTIRTLGRGDGWLGPAGARVAWAAGVAGAIGACGPRPPEAVTVPVVVDPAPPPPPLAAGWAAPADAGPRSGPADADVPPPPFVGPVIVASGPGPGVRAPRPVDVASAKLAVRWRARVGKTTFRTTMALVSGDVVIGTHGDTLDRPNEASDAVYVLEGKTGRVVRKIPSPDVGDRDVAGVAIDGSDVVFSTDAGLVVKARLADGKVAWTARVPGSGPPSGGARTGNKLRAAPALGDLDGVGARDVVVGDELGALRAFSGDDGHVLWTRETGENDYGARGFVGGASVVDVDGDGRDDVVAGARDGALVAYRGATGEELWRAAGDSGIHATPMIVDLDGDGRREVLAAWSYGRIAILDARTGGLRYEQTIRQEAGGIDGLFASPVPMPPGRGPRGGHGLLVVGTAWWGGRHGQAGAGVVDGVAFAAQTSLAVRSDEGRVSATALVMELPGRGVVEAIVGTEAGELLAIDPSSSARPERRVLAKLGGPIEAPALAADVDGDGTYELLVASNDGFLTCLSTGARAAPIVGRFRGESPDNRGDLGAIPLAWATAPLRPLDPMKYRTPQPRPGRPDPGPKRIVVPRQSPGF